jgi:hypothetical protein
MLQGDSLVPLMTADGEGYGHRLVISEEVSNRDIDAAGAWGSMFFGRWHILNSRQFLLLSHLFDSGFGWDWFHEFSIATRVYDLRRDPDENRYLNPFLFDPFVKWQLHRTLTRLRRHSEEIHRHLGSIGDEEPLEVDPEVQERLRALGYH